MPDWPFLDRFQSTLGAQNPTGFPVPGAARRNIDRAIGLLDLFLVFTHHVGNANEMLKSFNFYLRSVYYYLMGASALSSALSRITNYSIKRAAGKNQFSLVLSRGSVVDFAYPTNPQSSAIVNAANEGCLGGGGVDGAISHAGGPNLQEDRLALPLVNNSRTTRCPTGQAKITGPGDYGTLNVPYVIHAVGPNYAMYSTAEEANDLLFSAYTESLERGKEAKVEAIAFSLLSSGIFRGRQTKKEVLGVGMKAIRDFEGYEELREVHLCAYSQEEGDTLTKIASEMGLHAEEQPQDDEL